MTSGLYVVTRRFLDGRNEELLVLNVTSQLPLHECKQKYHKDRQGH